MNNTEESNRTNYLLPYLSKNMPINGKPKSKQEMKYLIQAYS